MKNVKVKDLRQGVTMYYVMAFPLRDKFGPAKVEQYSIQSRAFLKPKGKGSVLDSFLSKTLWYKESHLLTSSWARINNKLYTSVHSVTDSGVAVGKTNYNFHRLFHTRKQAQRYADRMNSGCLTHEERQHAVRMNLRDEEFDSWSTTYWDDDYSR